MNYDDASTVTIDSLSNQASSGGREKNESQEISTFSSVDSTSTCRQMQSCSSRVVES